MGSGFRERGMGFHERAAEFKRTVEQDARGFYGRHCEGMPKRSGENWQFRCPLHKEDTPSFTVYADGHFHCFGCGKHGDAIDFLAKLKGCSVSEALEGVDGGTERVGRAHNETRVEPTVPGGGAGEECASETAAPTREGARREYPAIDPDGKLIGVHVRTDKVDGKKTFSWQWAEGGKARRSVNDLPLYGLPRLAASVEHGEDVVVVVTEGEKCADALNEAGVLALGLWGAGHNPREEALAVLKDRRVVLWPDNDASGVTCMKRLGKKLLPVARDVSVVVWPNAPEKADAYDYLAWCGAGGLAELRVGQSGERVGRPAVKHPAKFADVHAAQETGELGSSPHAEGEDAEITTVPYARWTLMQGAITGYTTAVTLDKVVAQTTWLWDNWIPNGYVTILAAEPGTGKSGLALWLVHSYLDGRPWPDAGEVPRDPATRKVLWLETDDCHGALRDRIATWDVRADAIVMLGDDGLEHADLSVAATVDKVRNLAAALDCGMIVIDTLSGAHPKDENSAAMRSLMSDLASLARDLNVPVICCHHLRKKSPLEGAEATMDRLRGSSAIAAGARSIIGLDKLRGLTKNDDGMEKARMRVIKANLCLPPQPLCYWIDSEGLQFERIDEELEEGLLEGKSVAEDKMQATVRLITEVLADGAVHTNEELQQLVMAQGISRTTFDRAAKSVRAETWLDRGKKWRRLDDEEEEEKQRESAVGPI